MSEPIGPGDWVEYLGARPGRQHLGLLTVGAIYQVSGVGLFFGEPWVSVVGPNPPDVGHPSPGWAAECFRPVYRPKERLIADLMTQVPADDLVSA